MNRRDFLRFLGGGVAATVALSHSSLASVEALARVQHRFDPERLLYLPDEPVVELPPEQPLVLVSRLAGVGVYRICDRTGSYWFDGEWRFVNAFDPTGRPQSILVLNGAEEGPDVPRAKELLAWRTGDRATIGGGSRNWMSVDRVSSLLDAERSAVAVLSLGEARHALPAWAEGGRDVR